MTPTVLLFDIDGTLLDTGGAGRRAMERALASVGAAGAARFSFAGLTDRHILRRALHIAGRQPSEALLAEAIEQYLAALADEVARAPAADYRVHRGVWAALDAAEASDGVAVGLGTGNVERGAGIKLGRVGLSDRFAFGGFGSDAEAREALLAVGARCGAKRLGVAVARCRVVVVGDTPRDITAARAIGAEAFAVATGTVPAAALAGQHPDHLYPHLGAPGALGALLEGNRAPGGRGGGMA